MRRKINFKRIGAIFLLAAMFITSGIPQNLSYMGTFINFAAESLKSSQATTLKYGLTYLNNNGSKKASGDPAWSGWYRRNMMRKEYLTGDPSDPNWGRFADKYIWCIAAHSVHPDIGATAIIENVYDYENLREIKSTKTKISKFNFTIALLTLYYLNNPTNLKDKYADVTDYIIAKAILTPSFEQGLLTGDWGTDYSIIGSMFEAYYGPEFNPDSTGSTRIYDELFQTGFKAGPEGAQWDTTYAESVVWKIWEAATFISELDWNENVGFSYKPEIEQESDGYYHAKLKFKNTDINRLFWAKLKPKATYGDWKFNGIMSDIAPTEEYAYIEFTSPTGDMPAEEKIAELYYEPGSELDNVLTNFKTGDIIQFRFEPGGKQDMIASALSGEFQITVGEGKPIPNKEQTVKRYAHDEGFEANYNVNLIKFDSETGKPLEGAKFDILEAFDDAQLDSTNLDLEDVPEYTSNLGSIIPTDWQDGDAIETNYNGDTGLNTSLSNLYNQGNADGSQFEKWEGWDPGDGEDPCPRDNDITGSDGYLYTGSTTGEADMSERAHSDKKSYRYYKGYCGGHPAPEVEYEPLPEPEYDEDGNQTNEAEIEAVDRANQKLHDEAWAKWFLEVETCERLVSEGGFFHAIDGTARAALEEDRDSFYEDFISLTYDYSAKETTPRDGYIIHGGHKDDIPVETRTVTSSEYKEYIEGGESLSHSGTSSETFSSETGEQDGEIKAGTAYSKSEKISSPSDAGKAEREPAEPVTATPSEIIKATRSDAGKNVTIKKKKKTGARKKSIKASTHSEAEDISDEEEDEEESEKKRSTPGKITLSGLFNAAGSLFYKPTSASAKRVSGRSAEDFASFDDSTANRIDPFGPDIVDWTFIIYDHRTEGEIHFNKQDLDLQGEHEGYDAYGDSNGDGTLEGAVYGLFAKTDIVHPDGETGVIYRQNNLVAVAATDRDGNGSFMAFTEAPGYTWDYSRGLAVKTGDGWADKAPGNMHTDMGGGTAFSEDNEKFEGHDPDNSDIRISESHEGDGTYWIKLSSNQGYSDTTTEKTSGGYPVSDNEKNNGNCWIGRPLILGDYYIKELTRSEGYELSVYGKDAAITNKDANEKADGTVAEGNVTVSDFSINKDYDGNIFTVSSTGTGEGGYDIYLTGLPEDVRPSISTYKYIDRTVEKTWQKPVYSSREVPASPGDRVIINGHTVEASEGDIIQLPNGTEKEVSAVSERTELYESVYPDNMYTSQPPKFSIDAETDIDEFITTVNETLEKSYRNPGEGAPWRLVKLTPEGSPKKWGKEIEEALSDMRAFNAVRLETIDEAPTGEYAVAILRYSYIKNGKASESIYDEQHEKVLVKKDITLGGEPGYIYAAFSEDELTVCEKDNGFITHASMPSVIPERDSADLYEDLTRIGFEKTYSPTYWIYSEGEVLLDENGTPVTETYISGYETVTETVTEEVKEESDVSSDSVYYDADAGQWVIHMRKEDILEDGKLYFEMKYDEDSVNVGGTEYPVYIFVNENVKVSASPSLTLTGSYIEDVKLRYESPERVISDAGTGKAPAPLTERPVRQKIKVVKDIATEKDGGYEDNTYNIEEVSKASNFRFKAYLKSNIERLYRDEAGKITWLDRNGNEISYDDMLESAFPEEINGTDGVLFKTNVRKIYTKATHDTSGNLTSVNGNNILAVYNDPETADENVALKAPYDTTIAPEGAGVKVNSALYSYRGVNSDTAKSDTIRSESNKGYTRLLETVEKEVESGTDLITVQDYNYDKFFDALETANTDKWDDHNQTYTSWRPLGNKANRTEYAENNAKASDMVRQFAIKWYLKDETAKLVANNGYDEDEAAGAPEENNYSSEIYDKALNNALEKAYNYLTPFFNYDLDGIYSIAWDGSPEGGSDKDMTTVSADADGGEYFYGTGSYLPYGDYIVVEQQPKYTGEDEAAFNDFINKHYEKDAPKIISVPSVYAEGENTAERGKLSEKYKYDAAMKLSDQSKEENYLIRFGEEWTEGNGDEREYVIRAHNNDGDFEIYKFGLEPDKLTGSISYEGGSYSYKGFKIAQDDYDPLKDYYNPIHLVKGIPLTKEQGADEDARYYADDVNKGKTTPSGEEYESDGIEKRYNYASVSEQKGSAENIRFEGESPSAPDNAAGAVYRTATAMQGANTAYEGLYAAMLVPYTVTEPEDEKIYSENELKGYADGKYRNSFYSAKLRIEKIDSETHENILHDDALFAIYKAQRDEETGDVLFYDEDTIITGSKEFLEAMKAENITPLERGKGPGELYSGTVKADTPITAEEDRVYLSDMHGNMRGSFGIFSTTADVLMKNEATNTDPKEYRNQTVGYLETPSPLGAGAYVIAELKSPSGYVRTSPLALEVYSDKVTYYKEGNRDKRVAAAIYEYVPDNATENGNKPGDKKETATIYAENIPIKLKVEKVKSDKDTVTFRLGTRKEGSLSELSGDPSLVFAYDSGGNYLGYAYKKGTLERLAALKAAGEDVEIVYNGGVFAGYGYVTRPLETADDDNKYVAGARLTLYDAIELKPSSDTEDYAYEGLVIERGADNNIDRMYIKEGYAGSKQSVVKETGEDGKPLIKDYIAGYDEDGESVVKKGYVWKEGEVQRPDTDILYYDLDSLSLTWTEKVSGREILYGWDKDHNKVNIRQLESDKANYEKAEGELSIYAFKGGQPYLEFSGGDFTKLKYNSTDKTIEGDFARPVRNNKTGKYEMSEGTLVYHLDKDGNRDSLADPYTGMAYITENDGTDEDRILVWPVNIARDKSGNIIAKDKITTSRTATIGENAEDYSDEGASEPVNQDPENQEAADIPSWSHTESGYITGSWKSEDGEESHRESTVNRNIMGGNMNEDILLNDNNGDFLKYMDPVYDENGLILYYQRSEETYDKATDLYDRNDDFVRQKDSDNLEEYNYAAYALDDRGTLYDGNEYEERQIRDKLYHRAGEGYILENSWYSSDKTPNDPFSTGQTEGQADIIKRLPAGTYIMEETETVTGYTKGFPTGVTVPETDTMKNISMTDETTKIYIGKTDAPEKDRVSIIDAATGEIKGEISESAGRYSYRNIEGVKLALYPAKAVADPTKPSGYRLEKTSANPLTYESTNSREGAREDRKAEFTTSTLPEWLERIPEGYYILEETEKMLGFVSPEPEEMHISGDGIISITLENDHTKTEIKKTDDEGKMLDGAEFSLHPAVTDDSGDVIYDAEGNPLYKTEAIDSFISDDGSDYRNFMTEFSDMYSEYGTKGEKVTWNAERSAKRQTEDGDTWRLEGGETVSVKNGTITFPEGMSEADKKGFEEAVKKAGKRTEITWLSEMSAKLQNIDYANPAEEGKAFPTAADMEWKDNEGKTIRIYVFRGADGFVYDYRFDYRELPGINEYANTYITTEGTRRYDYLPSGEAFVLTEDRPPYGYAKAEPIVIIPADSSDIYLYTIENTERELIIGKSSSKAEGELKGAVLALYRAAGDGSLIQDPEYLIERWKTGEDGIYTDEDYVNGRIPEGYKKGDYKPHYISRIPYGKYWLCEEYSPAYYGTFEPVAIEYDEGSENIVIKAVNEPAKGELTVNKKNESDEKLTGVIFELAAFDDKGKPVSGFPVKLTDIDGTVKAKDLPVGRVNEDGSITPYRYVLTEIRPPEGYKIPDKPFEFEFSPDAGSYVNNISLVETDVINEETEFDFSKKILDREDTEGAFVEGAELAIYEVEGISDDGEYIYSPEDEKDRWISDGEKHTVKGLSAGKMYLFAELKAPDGYALMPPVLFTVSDDGRNINMISDKSEVVSINYIPGDPENPDKDSIESVTVRGRYISCIYTRILSGGTEIARFLNTGDTVKLYDDILKDGEVYTFEEHTVYSTGEDEITASKTGNIFLSDGAYNCETRTAYTEVELESPEGDKISGFKPSAEAPELEIINNVSPENPRTVIRNRNGEDGEALVKGQPIFNYIEYINTSDKTADFILKAEPDKTVNIIDPRDGKQEGTSIIWKLENIPAKSSGYVSFITDISDNAEYMTKLTVTLETDKDKNTTEKIAPLSKPGMLTVNNMLTGSGKDIFKNKTETYKIMLFDKKGKELSGSYRYYGSTEGSLKSGEEIKLGGNEFITLDPYFKEVSYIVENISTGEKREGVISSETGSSEVFSKNVTDTSSREVFRKGETYILSEYTAYSDGDRNPSNRFSFSLSETGGIDGIAGYDKEKETRIIKNDSEGKPLEGAELKLYNMQGELIEEWISDGSELELKGLEPGTYKLRETAPPEGYAYSRDIIFTVTEDTIIQDIVMTDKPTRLEILKTDKDGKPLKGAEFELKTLSGEVIESWKTDGSPHVISGILTAGKKYLLYETKAPSGYIGHTEPVEITIPENGETLRVELENTKKPGSETSGKDYTIKIRKEDDEGNSLAGAKITARDESGRYIGVSSNSSGTEFTVTVHKAGVITITEVTSPEGYVLNPTEYLIEIPETGDAVLLNGDGFFKQSGTGYTFVLVNEKEEEETPPPPGEDKKGYIRAEFDGSMYGLGRYKINGTGEEIKLTKTGDDFPAGLMLAAAFISGGTLIFMAAGTRHKNKNKKKKSKDMSGKKFLISMLLPAALVLSNPSEKSYAAESGKTDYSQEITYTNSTGDKENPGFKEKITVNGREYELKDISYEILDKRKKEAVENIKIISSEPFTDDPENHIPPSTLSEEGITYYLNGYETEETVIDAREESVKDTVVYESAALFSEVPETTDIEVTDQVSGKKITVTVPLKSYEWTDERWIEGFEFPVTVYEYDAQTFLLGDKEIFLSEEEPLKGYEKELLDMIGVSGEYYRINNTEWSGEPYMEGDILCRRLTASGEMKVGDCRADYEGIANLPETKALFIKATYTDVPPANSTLSSADGGEYEYTIKATGKYDTVKLSPWEKLLTFIKDLITNPITLAVLIILLFIVTTIYRLKKRKKEERDKILYSDFEDEERQ